MLATFKKIVSQTPKSTRWQWLVLGIALTVSATLCLWNISNGAQFLGDQGRDALIVARIFKEADLVFIGPVTSVGNMYLGPFYYYFMMPFLMLTYPSPLGPVFGVLLAHLLTVFLIYYWGKRMFSPWVAVAAAALYAINMTVVFHARFSWNPNITPLFSLITFYSLWQVWQGKRWYFVAAIAGFSALVQLHYITLLYLPVLGIVWVVWAWRRRTAWKEVLWPTVAAVAVFVASLSPLILFDLRHDNTNLNAFVNMFIGSETFTGSAQLEQQSSKVVRSIKELHGRSLQLFFETSIGQLRWRDSWFVLVIAAVTGWQVFKTRTELLKSGNQALTLLVLTLGISLLGLSVYENSVFNHYILFLFPMVFLLLSWVGNWIWQQHWVGRIAVASYVVFYVGYSILNAPVGYNLWSMSVFKTISEDIAEQISDESKYDLVSLSQTGDSMGMSYRYYLYTMNQSPVEKERIGEVDQLVVVYEEPDTVIDPSEHYALYELIVFPKAENYKTIVSEAGVRFVVYDRSEISSQEE